MGDHTWDNSERASVVQTDGAPDHTNPKEEDVAGPKSTRSPAFQFYPRDFLSSSKVDRMSMTERGAYITLLSRCWLDDGLPTDLGELAGMCRMRPAQFVRMWENSKLGQCFHERGGRFHHDRLDRERKAQTEFRKRQKDKADKRWHSRGNAVALPDPGTRHASGNALHLQSASANRRTSVSRPLPDGHPYDVWFGEFHVAYPVKGRTSGPLPMQAFLDVFKNDTREPPVVWDEIRTSVRGYAKSDAVRAGKVKNMTAWLQEGYYGQQHDTPAAIGQVYSKPYGSYHQPKTGTEGQ